MIELHTLVPGRVLDSVNSHVLEGCETALEASKLPPDAQPLHSSRFVISSNLFYGF